MNADTKDTASKPSSCYAVSLAFKLAKFTGRALVILWAIGLVLSILAVPVGLLSLIIAPSAFSLYAIVFGFLGMILFGVPFAG